MNNAPLPARYFTRLYSPWFLPVGVLLIGAMLSYGVGRLDNERQRNSDRARVALKLNGLAAQLENYTRSAFNETEGIAQLLSADGFISSTHLSSMAQGAIDSAPYIHHLALAPDDIVSDVYPLAGNESIIGLDYRTLAGQYPLLEKARLSGSALIAGPLQLYQGGRALIYRRPVFLSGHKGRKRYWGSISVVADLDWLLRDGGISANNGMAIALRGHDGLGENGDIIYGDPALFNAQPILVSVNIPGGSWQLAGQPIGGWPPVPLLDSLLFVMALGGTLLLSLFALQISLSHRLVRRRNAELWQEITERQIIKSSLIQSEDRFRALFERSPDPIWIVGQDGVINLANSAALRALGFEPETFHGITLNDISPEFQPEGQRSAEQIKALLDQAHSEGSLRFEWLHKRVDNSLLPTEVTLCTLQLAHEYVTYAIVRDISERKRAKLELERLAHFDAITGLPNRVSFYTYLADAIDRATQAETHLAVLILDLDGFKLVNDSLGHPMGDLLLQQATHRFTDAVRPGDIVARLGGDEFAFILYDLSDAADAIPVVKKLLQSLHKSFDLQGTAALVTASIGVAMGPQHAVTAQGLLTQADTAMYAAKESGRNDYRFYQAQMTTLIQARVALERALRHALECNEFEILYQPKLDLCSGCIAGAEALIRWRNPELGLVSPADFIPLAERTGLIIPIGEWVLDQVCSQARRWRASGRFSQRIAVNVAVLQIERSDFVETVRQALQRHDLPPQALEIEVTESLVMDRQELAQNVLGQLQRMGLTVAVDDFGTGYSSLAYLKDLPIDNLKIDRTFISDLPHGAAYIAITRAIIDLGHALGFTVTAEGIETPEQLAFLQGAGCDTGQGYLISRPMPVSQFEVWLDGVSAVNTPNRRELARDSLKPDSGAVDG
ncbi:bifunctional diguanylate cyclase/phosphodiesterase [Pseudomonas sp. DWP3-1-2]|uniref:bifunctional diguanylate cyclase/phosphodiesterase n=1 Tax=Pseudomonas sp. DWP3-1-2 TaxID=2804645 RepID=UPI003CF6D26F